MKKLTKALVVTALGATTVLALAGWKGQGWRCHKGDWNPERAQQMATWFVDDTLDEIDATDAQRKAVHALKDDLLQEGLALHGERKELRKDALALWESQQPDPQKVHAMVDARIEEMRKFAHDAADSAIELHKILTPEQRAELAARARERMGE